MRRISIDTFGLTGAKDDAAFYPKRRRPAWYLSRPRLLTTLLCFLALYTWLNFGGHEIVIPRDPWDYVRDDSVTDIMNATLGVGRCLFVARSAPTCHRLVRSTIMFNVLTCSKFQKLLVLNLPAATTNMQLEFVDGVTGDSIKQSAYPPPQENIKLLAGIRGSWRTHMNALQRYLHLESLLYKN
jgi:hypothetical protein